jgi:predicted  nucleic acid-binding Zn-ribbon protein
MNLLDRILGLKSEQQNVIDTLVGIIEENEDLKKEIQDLNEKIAHLEADMQVAVEELDKERQKVKNIEDLIEEGISRIKNMD